MRLSGLKNVPSLPGQTCPAEVEACRGKEHSLLTSSLWPCVLHARLPPSTWPLTRSRHLGACLWGAPQPTGILTKQCATPSHGPLGRSGKLLPVGSTSEGVSLQNRAVRGYRPCSTRLNATPTRRHCSPGHPDRGWPEHSPTRLGCTRGRRALRAGAQSSLHPCLAPASGPWLPAGDRMLARLAKGQSFMFRSLAPECD